MKFTKVPFTIEWKHEMFRYNQIYVRSVYWTMKYKTSLRET